MKIKSNIWKYYVFSFLSMFIIFLPFIVYYFQELGFSIGKIAILNSAAALALFFFEIPSGYIADRFGRKNSLILSVIMQIISMIILYMATSFSVLIIAHIMLGLGVAFLSGADTAFIYDSLLVMKKEKDFKKIAGKAKFFGEIAVILSALIATLIIKFGIRQTILWTLVGHVLLLFVTLSFKEPEKHKNIEKKPAVMADIIRKSLQNKKLLGLFLYSFIVIGVLNTVFVIYQPYFRATKLPLYLYGIAFAIFSIFAGLAALKAHDIEKKLGVFGSLIIMPLFLVGSLIGASLVFVWFGFIFFFLREMVRGFIFPVLDDYTNKIAVSSERATVLSIGSMFSRLGMVIISTTVGFMSDSIGIKIVLLYTGLILLGFTLIVPVLVNKSKSKHLLSK